MRRGRYYFSVKVRLRSQVTTRVAVSMETEREKYLGMQIGSFTDRQISSFIVGW